jgi:hypothetical protein
MNYTKRSRSTPTKVNLSSIDNDNSKRKKGSVKIKRKLFGSQSESLSPTQVVKSRSSSLTPTQVVKSKSRSKSPNRSKSPSKKSRSSSLTEPIKSRSSSLSSTKEVVYQSPKKKSVQSPNKNPFEEFIKKKQVVWYEPKLGRYVTINEMYREYDQFERNKKYMNSWDDLLTWSPSPKKIR